MESQFIDWLRRRLPSSGAVSVGIGDDAAVLSLTPGAQIVVTADALTDGVDFHLTSLGSQIPAEEATSLRGYATAREVGYKALAVNLSDLAAMAARPVAALISLVLPRIGAAELAREIYEGMLPLAEEFGVAIVGGDTNTWDQGLVISVTALGETQPIRGPGPVAQHRVWTRAGAVAGDELFVTGEFGGSLLRRHLRPQPRLREATYLSRHYLVHAAVDVSDGLTLDLSHIAAESGCAVELDLAAIPVSADARTISSLPGDSKSPLEHALGDGEDFELVLAVPPSEGARLLKDLQIGCRISRVGRFVAGSGLWTCDDSGSAVPSAERIGPVQRTPLIPRGYRHV